MTKRHSAKYKIDRRMGENIWGRAKSPVNNRNYGPGEHGQSRKNKPSDFGIQLKAKQKLKGYYGNISERQFSSIFKKANRIKGDTGENLIGLLETRLDSIVYRAKFVSTIFSSRQFINHRHILVNGSVVNIPSYNVKTNDIIEINKKSRQLELVLIAIKSAEREIPDYITVEHDKKMKAVLNLVPNLADVPYPVQMEPNLVVEFYSR